MKNVFYVMPNSFTKTLLRNFYLLETVVGVRDIEVIKSEMIDAVMGFIFKKWKMEINLKT